MFQYEFFDLSGLAIFRTSFTVVGRWFIFRKLHLIASDMYLFFLSLSLTLVVFILSAIVSLGDFGICSALFITLSFVLRGCPLFNFDIRASPQLNYYLLCIMCHTWITGLEIVCSLDSLASLEFPFVVFT